MTSRVEEHLRGLLERIDPEHDPDLELVRALPLGARGEDGEGELQVEQPRVDARHVHRVECDLAELVLLKCPTPASGSGPAPPHQAQGQHPGIRLRASTLESLIFSEKHANKLASTFCNITYSNCEI